MREEANKIRPLCIWDIILCAAIIFALGFSFSSLMESRVAENKIHEAECNL